MPLKLPPLLPYKGVIGQYGVPRRKPDHRFSAVLDESRVAGNAWDLADLTSVVFLAVKSEDPYPQPEYERKLLCEILRTLKKPKSVTLYVLYRDQLRINVFDRNK